MSDGHDGAPTILNGPGLATAGNIDPTAPDTVDGLVPGINYLRAAGYNVVTWDPRGEFDSTGQAANSTHLNTKARTSRTSSRGSADQHRLHATQAMDDPPTIRGSAWSADRTAAAFNGERRLIDPRIDVIVPGIAWNNLTGLPLHERGVQDLLLIAAAAGVGDKGLPDQSRRSTRASSPATCWASSPRASRHFSNRSGPAVPMPTSDHRRPGACSSRAPSMCCSRWSRRSSTREGMTASARG